MFELKYYEAIIETIHQGAYDICTPVDTDELYKLARRVKKAGRCYKEWCGALLLRCKDLEAGLLGSFRNYRYMEQLIVLAVLIEILNELYEGFLQEGLA
ncbi:hypothetical protein [Pedobacter africanus]|uniref:Uncharacterized protein n=1 Tax=Pedobacter africanus TaxID=151894 RepID=A0A1W1Z5X8_9SPHI|nr:hypothetical protein [Pedobacter africanus]SMC43877.1 hypothetical protein SAMN04488524_0409 [Pedobacter africanus]